jgi:hypothetical protein
MTDMLDISKTGEGNNDMRMWSKCSYDIGLYANDVHIRQLKIMWVDADGVARKNNLFRNTCFLLYIQYSEY